MHHTPEVFSALLEREQRRAVSLRAFAYRADGTTADAVLTNLSYQGCHVRCEIPFEIGERLDLAVVRLGRIRGEVRWAGRGQAGLRFVGD